MKPTLKTVLTDPGHLVAFGFGAGLSPFAPGTMGSIVAIPFYCLLHIVAPGWWSLVVTSIGFIVGVPISDRTGRWVGDADYGGIVWDEICAMWLVLYFVPFTVKGILAALVVFRVFDILKPWPISVVDAKIKNGLGVMLDDLLAGLLSVGVLRAVMSYYPSLLA
ncbi:MAG: phosphatidylglycerophosphatase A [Vicinamibacteria bacterium]